MFAERNEGPGIKDNKIKLSKIQLYAMQEKWKRG
jgi:hypothetical protein